MSKPNQFKETEKLYNYYNSHEHRVERVNDMLDKLKDIKDINQFFKDFYWYNKELRKELVSKKYKNTMWYCHD
tara:strand:- start:579 stop:797 length:219 start_codon:yes stop_codon:yes gene_type:complete